ncbi:MAG: hypothetical protein IJ183_07170 [Prevotella sp.]|nr:hypothetical protein [Prevotella sp.]MBQ9237670.1 hypothetical protein [Prevotella sp.]MBQ9561060.1 hypothetical protein [Prevotella sp.]MBR1839929.1 hypothetical protein [Prevotella sp.]
MNIQSYILLAIVLVSFFFVLRYVYRGGGKRDCCKDCDSGSCNCCNR